jgi:hypothetical protein
MTVNEELGGMWRKAAETNSKVLSFHSFDKMWKTISNPSQEIQSQAEI